jgi:hypothetical protein
MGAGSLSWILPITDAKGMVLFLERKWKVRKASNRNISKRLREEGNAAQF